MGRFKVGDKVTPIKTNGFVAKGCTYVVKEKTESSCTKEPMVFLDGVDPAHFEWFFESEAIINSPLYKALS